MKIVFILSIPIVLYAACLALYLPYAFRRRVTATNIDKKNIIFIIPTYNDERGIKNTLKSIEALNSQHFISVLIINDGSTDGTGDLLTNWREIAGKRFDYQVHNIEVNSGLKGIALSYAKPYVKEDHDVIVVMDGDSILDRDALDHAVIKLFSDDQLAAVCGMILPSSDKSMTESLTQKLQDYELAGAFHGLRLSQCSMSSISCLSGAFTIHKAEAIKDVGWFNHWMVEDICWTWKAKARKWRLGFSESSLIFTECPDKFPRLWKQRRRWSRGRVEALKASISENGLSYTILGWFILWVCQVLFVPALIVMLAFNPFLSVTAFLTIYMMHCYYALAIYRYLPTKYGVLFSFKSALWTSFLIDFFLFIPNMLGILDEVLGREKRWLTR
jgi:poly-beta-1,6-N-acetyl-D-glucosamine synthase